MVTKDLGKVVPEKGVDYMTAEEIAQFKTEIEADLQSQITTNADNITTANGKITTLQSVTGTSTDTFSAESTYSVGDIVIKDNKVYRCITAITTAGAWDSTKWEEINVRQEQDEQNEKIQELKEYVELIESNYETNTVTIEGIGTIEDSLNGYSDSTLMGNTYQETTSISEGDEYDSPSPEHQQPIHNVSGDVEIESSNKNIFTGDYSQFDNSGGEGTTYAYFRLPNDSKQYTMTLIAKNNFTATSSTFLGFTQKGGTNSGASSSPRWAVAQGSGTIVKGTIISVTSSNNHRFISLFSKSAATLKNFTDNFDIILEEGEAFTSYEPHQGESITFSLGSMILRKVGNYCDKIYKENGKWWFSKQIEQIVLDGTETWSKSSTTNVDRFIQGTARSINVFNCISNYFVGVTNISTNYDVGVIAIDSNVNSNLRGRILVNFSEAGSTTLEQFLDWISSHNIILYYILGTPTVTEITDSNLIDALEIFSKLKTYKPITNIMSSSDDLAPDIKIKYLQNPLVNMQNDITSMQAQILELAGGE